MSAVLKSISSSHNAPRDCFGVNERAILPSQHWVGCSVKMDKIKKIILTTNRTKMRVCELENTAVHERKKSGNLWLSPFGSCTHDPYMCREKCSLSTKTVRGPSQSSIKLQLSNFSVPPMHRGFCSVELMLVTEIPAFVVDTKQPVWPQSRSKEFCQVSLTLLRCRKMQHRHQMDQL